MAHSITDFLSVILKCPYIIWTQHEKNAILRNNIPGVPLNKTFMSNSNVLVLTFSCVILSKCILNNITFLIHQQYDISWTEKSRKPQNPTEFNQTSGG